MLKHVYLNQFKFIQRFDVSAMEVVAVVNLKARKGKKERKNIVLYARRSF